MRNETVLVADDDDDIREIIAFSLRDAGFRVLTAGTGTQALAAVETHLPDAVVLDIAMPELDGFAVCYRLQQLRATIEIPTIVVSSTTSHHDIDLAYTIGADDYLPKPVRPAQLVDRVRSLLDDHR
ncbi:response regulator transcription factor [Actinoplanes sp. TFC3]|uniref:response regulator transcription factor n=1 Tax=Actinoplanes sp. TFC3 TaxID=1710355 RepID=UPI00082D910F|nr:response regulator [Actinoplanes sp. TFC3]